MLSITRQQIAAAAGATSLVLLAACTSSNSGSNPARSGGATGSGGAATSVGASTGASTAADSNKTLTIAIATDPTSVEPCDTQSADGVGIIRRNVTEELTDIDPQTGKVAPELATSWTHDDPTTWTFKLRPGVKFQDGTPFDAAAAVFNINRTTQKSLSCLNLEALPSSMTATAVDPTTLKVVTGTPDPILPLEITWVEMVSTKTPANAKTSHPIGTGPYTFVSHTPGKDLKLERFAGYWGDKPQAAAVDYIFRNDSSVQAATVKTGEADIAVPIAPQDATNDDRTKPYTQDRVIFLRLDTDQSPLNNLQVRQAIGYAVNKDQIVSALMGKTGKPTDQMVAPSVNGYIASYKGPSYDPAKAKSLVSQAKGSGVNTGQQIQLVGRNGMFPGASDVLQAVVQNLNDIGLNVKLVMLDNNAYTNQIHAVKASGQPVTILAASSDNVTGDASFSVPKYISSKGSVSTVRDPQVDSLLDKAAAAEGDQRASLYQQAIQWEYEHDYAIAPIAEQFSLLLLGKGVEYQPNGMTGLELQASQVHITG